MTAPSKCYAIRTLLLVSLSLIITSCFFEKKPGEMTSETIDLDQNERKNTKTRKFLLDLGYVPLELNTSGYLKDPDEGDLFDSENENNGSMRSEKEKILLKDSSDLALLGEKIFFDKNLSGSRNYSCNTCHNLQNHGIDSKPIAQKAPNARNVPSIWNSSLMSVQYWDGRAKTLEQQAIQAFTSPFEMANASIEEVLQKIKDSPEYVQMFDKAFPKSTTNGKKEPRITIEKLARAVASFERKLISRNSKYDLAIDGEVEFNSSEREGAKIFEEVGCMVCHSGPMFAGPRYPIGEGYYMRIPVYKKIEENVQWLEKYNLLDDLGRYQQTKNKYDKNSWRVPTLRNIALTSPYFHNGSIETLEEAIDIMAKAQLNKELSKKQISDVTAFLKTLTGETKFKPSVE